MSGTKEPRGKLERAREIAQKGGQVMSWVFISHTRVFLLCLVHKDIGYFKKMTCHERTTQGKGNPYPGSRNISWYIHCDKQHGLSSEH